MKIDQSTPIYKALLVGGIAFAFVSVARYLATGRFEALETAPPALLGGAMWWLGMSTLSERGQIHSLLKRHGLIRRRDK